MPCTTTYLKRKAEGRCIKCGVKKDTPWVRCGDCHKAIVEAGRTFRMDEVRACGKCGELFRPRQARSKYCGVACRHEALKKRVACVCDYCGIRFEARPSEVAKATEKGFAHRFCGKRCQYRFHLGEKHPRWITDRSALKSRYHSVRQSKEMAEWRTSVFSRDDWTCQLCGDRSRVGHPVTLNAHHILRFIDRHDLWFDVANGVTLCEPCHQMTKRNEHLYVEAFQAIVTEKALTPSACRS